MTKSQLIQVVEDKCLNGYGVDLKQLKLMGWRLLTPPNVKKTGDLADDILNDENFLGALQIPCKDINGHHIDDSGLPFYRYRLFFHTSAKLGFGGLKTDLYKKKRYRQRVGTDAHAFLPQNLDLPTLAKDISEPLYLIEGEPKCMAMALLNYFTVGLSGVEMFAVKGDVLPELLDIAWQGRDVIICFDSDWHVNDQVKGAIQRVGRQVMMLGGNVFVVDLPQDGPKGIDEFLVEYGPDALDEVLESAIPYDNFATFEITPANAIKKNMANVQLALMKLGHTFAMNQLSNQVEVTTNDKTEEVDDGLYASCIGVMDLKYKLQPPRQMLFDAILMEAYQNKYHPVQDYLATCKWDEKERISTWLMTVFGCEDTPLNRAISRLTLMGPVARALKPGCKFDTITILVGKQGTFKSTALQSLCPVESWFSDDLDINESGKELLEHTSGRWIIEASELDHMTKGETGKIKSTVSRQVDIARPAYGRVTKSMPRAFSIIGTANASVFLKDLTGNRRFLPVDCPNKGDVKWVVEYRDQLWAEAAVAFEQGEPLYLNDKLAELAAIEQEARMVHTPIYEQLLEWFGANDPGKVLPHDIWVGLGFPEAGKRPTSHSHQIRETMESLGFILRTLNMDGKRVKGWIRATNFDPKQQCHWEVSPNSEGTFIMKYITRETKKRRSKKSNVSKMGKKKKY